MKSRFLNNFSIARVTLAAAILASAAVARLDAATITVISLADGGPGSLRQAILDSSSGGTIAFDPVLSTKTIVLTNGELVVSKNLTINGLGAGNLAVSGNSTSRVFHVSGGVNVSINGLTINAGTPGDDGGAILNEAGSTLSIGTSVLSSNTGINGGAINNAGTLTVHDSTLSDNSAAAGGAIYSVGSLTVINSSIQGNTADANGGGIVSLGSTTISNTLVSANDSTTGQGGGLYSSNSVLTVLASQFTGNSASNGGALFTDAGSAAQLRGSTVSNNFSTADSGLGGGIANFASLTLSNSAILANSGGVFLVGGGIYSSNGVITVLSSAVADNQSAAGGGIFNDLGTTGTLVNATISGNLAFVANGGGIYSFGPLNVISSTISNNGANIQGGGIDATNSDLVVSNSTVTGNGSATAGGIILESNTGTITHSTLTFNESSDSGGILNLGALTLENSSVNNNFTEGNGGGIRNGGTLTVNQSTVANNFALNGGGIYHDGSTLNVVRSTINDNSANAGVGGGVDAEAGAVSILLSTITGNDAVNGGGVFVDDGATLTLSESTLSGNSAGDGDQLDNSGGTVTVDNTIFANPVQSTNISNENGGTFTSLGHNLSDDDESALLNQPGDLNSANPGLGDLADNGGPTLTLALQFGSDAIGAGGPLFASLPLVTPTVGSLPVYPPFTDQRGAVRFACGTMDIGAFELSTNASPTVLFTLNGPATITNFCPVVFVDPGTTAINTCGDALQISGGGAHSLALRTDGSVAAWGDNSSGQTNVPANLEAINVSAGGAHSLAVSSDNNVVAWGSNSNGQTDLPTDATNGTVVAVAAGGFHSLALKNDGTVIGWGDNTYGQSTPPTNNNVVAIAAGRYHSLGLLSDGTVIGWGAGSFTASPEDGINYGQTAIPDGLNNIVAISAGAYHSMALRSDGTVFAWGAGLGGNSVFVDFGQSQVPDIGNVVSIAAGGFHSLALISDGTVVGWGDDQQGQVSGASAVDNAVAIAAGTYHSLAIQANGTVVGWGSNSNGQLNATIDLRSDLSSLVTTGDIGTTNGLGSFTRTYTLNGVPSVAPLTRTIVNIQSGTPSFTNPQADIVRGNDFNKCGATVFYPQPKATDSCGTPLTPVVDDFNHLSGSFFPIGTTLVTYTVTDSQNQPAQESFNVTVQDVQPPTLTCQNLTTNTAPGECSSVPITFAQTVSDNCPGVTVTYDPPSGSTFPKGTNTVNATAVDAAGNTNTCSFTVTVVDRELPVWTCPADITTNAQSVAGAIVTFAPSVTDNCPGVTVATAPGSLDSGDTFPIGLSTVTRVATDASGNQSICQFNIRVLGPRANLLDVQTQLLALRDQVNAKNGSQILDKAIKNIVLANNAWSDDTHVVPFEGNAFFKEVKAVEQALKSLLHHSHVPIATATIQDLANRVEAAARVVAEVEVSDATKAGANPGSVSKANATLAQGKSLASSGNLTGAVGKYGSAWKTAESALAKTF